jgi:hypothetical protein
MGVVAFMVSAQWEEALSPLSSNPALDRRQTSVVVVGMVEAPHIYAL